MKVGINEQNMKQENEDPRICFTLTVARQSLFTEQFLVSTDVTSETCGN